MTLWERSGLDKLSAKLHKRGTSVVVIRTSVVVIRPSCA